MGFIYLLFVHGERVLVGAQLVAEVAVAPLVVVGEMPLHVSLADEHFTALRT